MGKDFLRKHKAVIDFNANALHLPENAPINFSEHPIPVQVAMTCVLPPFSQTVFPTTLLDMIDPGTTGIIEGTLEALRPHHLNGAATLVTEPTAMIGLPIP